MKLALLGYGRMGRTIERLATARGHEIALTVSSSNADKLSAQLLTDVDIDVAIDFSLPSTALTNIKTCMEAKVPCVSGTTAWLHQWDEAVKSMDEHDCGLLYASNFSIGVNIVFAANKMLARLMADHKQYTPTIHEVHHTGKLDAPSGTAITLAEGVVEITPRLSTWTKDAGHSASELLVTSERIDPAPGTHHVRYISDIDEIELTHTAKSRDGFAMGAVLAAEYMIGRRGLHTMADVLDL